VLSTPPAFVLSQDQTLQQKPLEKQSRQPLLTDAKTITIGTGLSNTLLSSQRTNTHRGSGPIRSILPCGAQLLQLTRSVSRCQAGISAFFRFARDPATRARRSAPVMLLGILQTGRISVAPVRGSRIIPPGSCRLAYFTRSASQSQIRSSR
jgi:hypothetical protein